MPESHVRLRYGIIDRERGSVVDTAPCIVLKPWSNPADFAAICELIKNVPPTFAADLENMLRAYEEMPSRKLGSFGVECLPYITHPRVKAYAEARLRELDGR